MLANWKYDFNLKRHKLQSLRLMRKTMEWIMF